MSTMKKALCVIIVLTVLCAAAAITAVAAAPDQPVYPGYNYYVHYPTSLRIPGMPEYIKASFDYDRDFIDIVPDYPDTDTYSYNGTGFRFPLATEEYGNMYDVSYTVDDTVITFEYRLKSGCTLDAYLDILDAKRAASGLEPLPRGEGEYHSFFIFDIAMKQKVVVNAKIVDCKLLDAVTDDGTVYYKDGAELNKAYLQGIDKPLPNLDPAATEKPTSPYKYLDKFLSWFLMDGSTLENYEEVFEHKDENDEVDWVIIKAEKKNERLPGQINYGTKPCYFEFGNRVQETDWGGELFKFNIGVYSFKHNRCLDITDPRIYELEDIERVWTFIGYGRLIGDIDGDKELTVADATYIQRCQVGMSDYPESDINKPIDMVDNPIPYYSDFNQDGERDIVDATAIQRFLMMLPYRCADWTPYPHKAQQDSTEPTELIIPTQQKPTNPAPTIPTQPATAATESSGDDTSYTGIPQITELKSTGKGLEISLMRVKGAEMYRVYRVDSYWNCTRIGETAGLSFIDEDVTVGESYTYTVRCMNRELTEFTSSYSSKGWKHTYMPQLGTPVISGSESSADGLLIRWGAVDGADQYRVYKDSGSGFVSIGDTRETSFTDTAAKPGETYLYTVRCLSCKGRGFASDYEPGRRLGLAYTPEPEPVIPKITGFRSTGKGVEIHLSKVDGAEKYRVYYKNSKGGWTSMGETAGQTFIDDDVNVGKSYTYTVRCINKALTEFTSGFNSKGWSYTYLPQLDTPHISGIELVSNGLKIKWGAVDGADLYRLYENVINDGRSEWVKVAETSETSYIHTVGAGTSHSYTVRCLSCKGKDFASDHDWFGGSFGIRYTPTVEAFTVRGDCMKLNIWSLGGENDLIRVYRKEGGSWKRIGELPFVEETWGMQNNEEERYVFYDYDVQPGKTYTYTVRLVSAEDGSFVSYFNGDGWSQKYGIEYYDPKLAYAIYTGDNTLLVQAEETKFDIAGYRLYIMNNFIGEGYTEIGKEPVYLRNAAFTEGTQFGVWLQGLNKSGERITAQHYDTLRITILSPPENLYSKKIGDRKYRFRWSRADYANLNLISEDGEYIIDSGVTRSGQFEVDLSEYPDDINWTCMVWSCSKDGISCSVPKTMEFKES